MGPERRYKAGRAGSRRGPYTTPALKAKTKYRIAYDGSLVLFAAAITQHFSSVSVVRTGWPR